MRKVILHHHFFKNAGSTLMTTLQREFGDGFIEHHPSGAETGHFLAKDLADLLNVHPKLRAISSHHLTGQNFNQASLLHNYWFCDFILVRHPIKRLVSMYRYYNTIESDYPIAQAAQSLPLSEFGYFMIKNYPGHMINPQVAMLSGEVVEIPTSERYLSLAIERLKSSFVCGNVDNYREAMVVAEHFIRAEFPGLGLHYAVVNSSPKLASYDGSLEALENLVGKNLYVTLEQLNRLDIELCNAADAEVAHRRKLVPHYDELYEDFSRRCASLESPSHSVA